MQPLVLGSSSPFRASLLEKLGLVFSVDSPDIDESAKIGESPAQLVQRLSETKAKIVAERHPEALIIASDQVAVLDGNILGKPGNHQSALTQLQSQSGKPVLFLTGLALYNAKAQRMQAIVEPFEVLFRDLSLTQIENYLHREQPYQCAGSFKSEGLGIALFSELNGQDPNSLIGLPLIRLTAMLAAEGIDVLG